MSLLHCWRLLVMAAGLLFATPSLAHGHEIPRHVALRAFVKPEGRTLRVLLRVPLEAMRDTDFPTFGAGYLDVARSDSLLRDAARLWIAGEVRAFENDAPLAPARLVAVRASLPADGMFARYEDAAGHLRAPPLAPGLALPWQQAMLDVALEYDIAADTSNFALRPTLAGLGIRTTSVVHFLPPDGADRVFTYDGDPGLLRLDPGVGHAAWQFLALGFAHILDGIDHLLFLLCLVLPFRRLRPVIALATSFTVAHSITLVASALGYAPTALWFPPLVETLIALSIVFMACENMLGAKLERRWTVAFAFGLVHGFGFSFALRDTLQFAGSHLAVSLAAFNVGVELGQLAVLAVAVPALVFVFRRVPERAGVIIASAFVAHTSWHWMSERFAELREHSIAMPVMDATLLPGIVRALLLALVALGIGWALHELLGRWMRRPARVVNAGVPLAALLVACGALTLSPRTSEAQGAKPGAAATKAAASRTTQSGVYTAEQATQGREVFTGNCSGCHTVASHTGDVFMLKWRNRSLDDLFSYIQSSMPKTAPGTLDESEYVMVVAYILKLNAMPAGTAELSADPELLRGIRIEQKRPVKKTK